MKSSYKFYLVALIFLFCGACSLSRKPSQLPSGGKVAEEKAIAVIRGSRSVLAPVYGPLAEQIVVDFNLAEKTGIGIDLGSGPGTLIIELCKRTQMHWINADINPHFFPYFYQQAEQCGFGHRVSAIMADAHSLPFRDDYADIVVSRGSFHFWRDKVRAFSEIYRVLKPGGVAYIGRGFSKNLPVETARKIRAKQRGKMKYDVEKTANELRSIMNELGIKDYQVHRPQPLGSEDVNYGVWVEFHKSEASMSGKTKEQPDGRHAR
jgi:SAM-dependent methyltransferase